MPDPWTTPGRPNATRFICPLGDWWHDEPSEPPIGGLVGYEARMKNTESLIRQHLERHSLEEWVKAATTLHQLQHAASALADSHGPDVTQLTEAVNAGNIGVNAVRWIEIARPIIEALNEIEAAADA